ncbi:MAG: TonB-dependent receptor domain-containing protein [Terriglobia bacterium]
MRLKGLRQFFSLFIWWPLLAFAGAAGVAEAGNLPGRVVDQSGAVVAGARVALYRPGQVLVATSTTGARGEFLFTEVPAGSYELVAEAPGMQPTQAAVEVTAGVREPVELVLHVGRLTTSVTVTPLRGEVQEAFALPSEVNVVSEGKLLRRPGFLLAQALREEVGIQIQQTSTHQAAVIIRGLTGQQVVHLIDGVRYNTSTFRPGPNQYFALIDPSFVERVEIERGPNSAQYGSDSLGGTVNVLPVRPYLEAAGKRLHGEIVPFFRSADLAGGGSARLSYGGARWNVFGGVSGRRVQDVRAGRGEDSHAAVRRFLGLSPKVLGTRLQDTAFTQWGGYARFSWRPAPEHAVVASYHRSEQHGGRRYDRLNGGNGDLIHAFDPQMLDFLYLRYEKQRLGGLDSLVGTFSYNRQRDDRTQQGGAGNFRAPIRDEFNAVDVFGYQVQGSSHIGSRQVLVFGGEVYAESIASRATEFDPATGNRSVVRGRFPDGSRYTTYGVFYQHSADLLANRVRAQGGLRYSAFRFRTFADKNPLGPSGQPTVPDFSTTLQDFTFNLGVVFRMTSHLYLSGQVSRGFRAPNTTDFSSVGLTSNGFEVTSSEAVPAGGRVGSTADASAEASGQRVRQLAPESLFNYELGVKFRRRRVTASLGGFVSDIKDFITKRTLLLPPGAVGTRLGGQEIVNQAASGAVFVAAEPRPVLVRSNVGDVRLWGVETGFEAELSRTLFLTGNFYYLRAGDKRTLGPPDMEGGMPPATGFLSLRWQPRGRFWVEAYSQLAGKQDRLSSLELADQRIGAMRSRSRIEQFFNNGAMARGLVAGGLLLPTGETLAEVQDRVLGPGVLAAPLFTKTAGFASFNLRGGYQVSEQTNLLFILENLLDRNYRYHGSGVDAPGANLQVSYRIRF